MVKLHFTIGHIDPAFRTDLTITSNNLQHDIAGYMPSYLALLLRFGKRLSREEDWTNMGKYRTFKLFSAVLADPCPPLRLQAEYFLDRLIYACLRLQPPLHCGR